MTAPRIDYAAGWRGVPGWLAEQEGACLEAAVQSTTGAIVELGTWAGRSLCCLAAARDLAKQDRPLVSFDSYPEQGQAQEAAEGGMGITPAEAKALSEEARRVFDVNVWRFYIDAVAGAQAYRSHGFLNSYKVGLLYIDDHHTGERLLAELAAWEPLMADECEVCIHDFFHEPYGLEVAVDRWMLDHPEWVMIETRLSMARIRRRWKAVPRAQAVATRLLTTGDEYCLSGCSTTPAISVLYNTWRIGGLDCLKLGLERQNVNFQIEVIIVDALYPYRRDAVAALFNDAPYRVRHMSPTGNPFPRDHGNRARNDAIRAARGEVCVWWCDYSIAERDSLARHYEKVARSGFRASSVGVICYGDIAPEALSPAMRAALPWHTIDDYVEFVESLPPDSLLWISIFAEPVLELGQKQLIATQHGHALPYELSGKIRLSPQPARMPAGCDERLSWLNGVIPEFYYYAKNEATAREVLLEVNGWEESFDDGHSQDDLDMGRRLSLAKSAMVLDKGNECFVPNPRPYFPLMRWKRAPIENRRLFDTLSAMGRKRAIQGIVNEIDQIPRAPNADESAERAPGEAGSAQPAVDPGARSVSTVEAAP